MGRLICLCGLVKEKEIVDALKKRAAVSTKDVQLITGAGRSCGRCLAEIDDLVSEYEKEKPKGLQKKLDFGF